jgi:hypothetical protein
MFIDLIYHSGRQRSGRLGPQRFTHLYQKLVNRLTRARSNGLVTPTADASGCSWISNILAVSKGAVVSHSNVRYAFPQAPHEAKCVEPRVWTADGGWVSGHQRKTCISNVDKTHGCSNEKAECWLPLAL